MEADYTNTYKNKAYISHKYCTLDVVLHNRFYVYKSVQKSEVQKSSLIISSLLFYTDLENLDKNQKTLDYSMDSSSNGAISLPKEREADTQVYDPAGMPTESDIEER